MLKEAADAYRGKAPDSVEGHLVSQLDEAYERLQAAFLEALQDAGKNYQETNGKKITTREGGVRHSVRETEGEKIKKAETARKHRLNQPSDISIRGTEQVVKPESVEAMDLEVDAKTDSVSPSLILSERTWTESDYVQQRTQKSNCANHPGDRHTSLRTGSR